MALVEFTAGAAQVVREILGHDRRLDEKLLVVEMHDEEAELTVKPFAELIQLQSDVEMIGPFRIPIGDEEVALFVREPESSNGGPWQLDYDAVGGKPCFPIRTRGLEDIVSVEPAI